MKIAALDIGGTSIKSGIWTGTSIQEYKEWETNAKNGGVYVMERAKEILCTYHGFDAIGISTAGQVDTVRGCIRYANDNIPGYTGMQVKQLLESEFKVPVVVENDVNAAAIGEGQFGAGRGHHDFLCITYGTGVGGAIVIDKKIYAGSVGSAGEFGGILIHPEHQIPGQPFSGCYERYASATALVSKVKKEFPELDTGRRIFESIHKTEVKQIVYEWIGEITLGLVSLVHIFNPSCIVLGGGVMAQPLILEELKKQLNEKVMSSFQTVELKQAELGNQAGLSGAAYLAKSSGMGV